MGQAVATAPDGMPLVDVPLPLPGHLPPSSAGDDSSTDLWLCSAAELAEAAAGTPRSGADPASQRGCPPAIRHVRLAIDALRWSSLPPAYPDAVHCPPRLPLAAPGHAAGFSVRGRRPGVQLDRWHAIKGAEPVGLTSNGRRVQLAVLFGAPRQLHLQPLAPLLAAYMAQGWSKPPGGPLPEPPEDSSD